MRRRVSSGVELEVVQRHLDELLDLLAAPPHAQDTGFSPPVDLRETDESYVALVDVPGVPASGIGITIKGRVLRIAGRKRPEREERERYHCHHMERGFGAFEVEILLPGPVQPLKARATLGAGVLEITLPRLSDRRDAVHTIRVEESGP